MQFTRRKIVAAGGGMAAACLAGLPSSRPARAAGTAPQVNILSNGVGYSVVHGGPGGDVTADIQKQTGTTGVWTPFGDSNVLGERFMRELSLHETQVDIGFLLNTRMTRQISTLLEPLDDYMAADPIEDYADIFPNMVDALKVDGKTYGVPFRQALGGLHYNETFLQERGLNGPPKTIEDVIEYAKRLTYTRSDGSKVYGFLLVGYPSVVGYSRGWNGDYITMDYKVKANQPPMIHAVTALRDMYVAGAFPKELATTQKDDQNTWMQQGRAAMCLAPMGRSTLFNDSKKSLFAGRIKTISIPSSPEIVANFDVAPANIETWNLVIPRNSTRKKLAWGYVREMVSKANVLKAALNGNGPIRGSTYDGPDYANSVPYAQAERRSLRISRPPMPAFTNAARADDLFTESFQAALLGMKTPQAAMDGLAHSVAPLLPKSS